MKIKAGTYLQKMRTSLMLIVCCFVLNKQYAQDIHFSNWEMSPLNLNPANTGMFEGDGRLIFNYRNQWKSVPVPYSTFSFGADFNLKKPLIKGAGEAVGIIFNHDGAGDGKYRITDFKIPINHKFSFKKDSDLVVALGAIAGITNISIDPNRLSYDQQWDGDAYNQGIYNGENFEKQSKTFADISLGTMIQKKFTNKFSLNIGYAINHINQPNISFNNTAGVLLRMKHTESLFFKYKFNHISSIALQYYGNQQQAFKENLAGLVYYHLIDPRTKTIFNIGILSRLGDAFITTIGLEYQNMRFQASYDYNYSQFKRATNSKGGFEISLIYIYAKPKIFIPKTRVCPIYM